jgi:hypothetical protein
MKGKAYPIRLKAQAIAALIAGESPTNVADRLKLPRTSVRNWKLALGPEKLAEVSRNTAGRLDDLLCDYLKENLRSLSAQAVAVRDPEYIEKQSASGIAALYETMSEHALLMIERLRF